MVWVSIVYKDATVSRTEIRTPVYPSLMESSLRALLIFFLSCPFLFFLSAAESDSDRVASLLSLQSRSESGVIHLDDKSLRRFLTSAKSRSYHLIVFFDAVHLQDKQDLHLRKLRSEFNLIASTYIDHNQDTPAASKVFFVDIEFQESSSSFSQFGVNALPHIRHVGPNVKNPKESDSMDPADFYRMAEGIMSFVEAKTKQVVGPIVRPPPVSKKQLWFLFAALMILSPFLIKRILAGGTPLHDPKLWCMFAIFVYFFSVSGAMHNIIRKMPMFMTDRNDASKLVFFYQGSGMQLGIEGFAVGFLYTFVGLILAFVTHFLVRVKNPNVQRWVVLIAVIACFWSVREVVYWDNWKTGYAVHAYWPSQWT